MFSEGVGVLFFRTLTWLGSTGVLSSALNPDLAVEKGSNDAYVAVECQSRRFKAGLYQGVGPVCVGSHLFARKVQPVLARTHC